MSGKYAALPTYNNTSEEAPRTKPVRKTLKVLAAGLLGIMLLATSARYFARGFGLRCMSSTKNGLPSHYTLPSGDKIPSVALGTRSRFQSLA